MFTRPKRILILTFGSLGDLHPYIAVALELKRRGHAPVIASFDLHRPVVEAAGLEFRPLRPGLEVFGSIESVAQKLFGSWRGAEYMVREIFMKHLRDSYADTLAAAREADLLVTHPLTFTALLVAEQRGLPWISTVLAPLNLFSAVEPPLFPAGAWLQGVRRLGVAPYRFTFGLLKRMIRHWERPLVELRHELGLPPFSGSAQFEGQFSPLLNLALFSPLLSAPQPDWPANTVLCGFARYDGAGDTVAARELETFLADGEAPIVFALGSSAVHIAGAADFWRHAVAATRRLGRRAILLTGRPPAADLPAGIRAFQYLPYSRVFPRAAAIVHQAGVGTLAQALAAGRPQLIVPVAFDQPDNARRAQRLGVAGVLPFKQVNAERLTAHLQPLLMNDGYAKRAMALAATLAGENGAITAADHVERILATIAANRG
jgi:UDP:flavonoid glycosyltransferase YjiC (YdhE family)